MVNVRLKGGLGNQMFQYAAGYALSVRTGSKLCLDKGYFKNNTDRTCGLSVFKLSSEHSKLGIGSFFNLKRSFSKRIPVYHEKSLVFDDGFLDLTAPVELDGYFQSENYFIGHAKEIRECFNLKRELSVNSLEYKKQILNSRVSISVHIRRGDYLHPKNLVIHGLLGADYYKCAFDLIAGRFGANVRFFLFSDDPSVRPGHYGLPEDTVTIVSAAERPHEDMYLMS